jgi:ApbE superfamily uncharacterized protein (UPF0280 family)
MSRERARRASIADAAAALVGPALHRGDFRERRVHEQHAAALDAEHPELAQ